MPNFDFLTKTEYKNGIIKYLKVTKRGIDELPFISRNKKQNKRSIHSTLWNNKDDIQQFVTIKPAPEYRTNSYSEQNKMIISLMRKIKMPKFAFVNELNDKNPDSPVYGTYHTHALVSEYRSKALWEDTFGKGFVSVDEIHNSGKQINYVLKYILKSTLPKGARVISYGFEKVKKSRVKTISEKIVSVELKYYRHVFVTSKIKEDAPF